MDGSKDGSSFAAAPAPVSGLGNYKGVMLCTRPSAEAKLGGGDDGDKPPFKVAGTAAEPLGLQPAQGKQIERKDDVKTRGPSAALRRHVQWLRELQSQVKEEQQRGEADAQQQEERKMRMQEVFKRQRDALRQLKNERTDFDRDELEAILNGSRKAAPAKPRVSSDADVKRITPKTHQQKPLWAMTEREKDEFQDEEADELIQFAENLDYDKYIGDFEFKQCLEVVRDRARKLQRAQDSFKDDLVRDFNAAAAAAGEEGVDGSDCADGIDGASLGELGPPGQTGRAFRRVQAAMADDRPDWDASTACSDERAPDREIKAAADRVLEAMPQLKAVHSKGSVQKLLEKVEKDQQDRLSSPGAVA